MNERIEKLALECYQAPEFDYKKFAELIVRECAKIAWEDSERYATIDNDIIMNGKADVLALCSHHIKEQFGVQE